MPSAAANRGAASWAPWEAYDPGSNAWSTKASMPKARFDLAAATANGLLYAIGGVADDGLGNQTTLATNQAYTP